MEICLNMKNKGTVTVNFTVGFGNNLFQYVCARLIAENNGLHLRHKEIPEMGIALRDAPIDKSLPTLFVNDNNYKKVLFTNDVKNCNVIVNGYFEDYKIVKPNIEKIRTWFPKIEITNKKDLILHLRLQNRLIQVSHNKNHIKADSFISAINRFNYDKLHIVTDAEKWDTYTEHDIKKIRDEIQIGPNPPSNSPWVDINQSLEYMNHLIDSFKELKPIVHCNGATTLKGSGGLRGDFMNDFNLIRSFNKIIVFNSTFSWWAAVLSGASEVAIFDPWKIAKPKEKRRNLGRTDFNGWFSWGSEDDLYYKKYNIK